MRRRVYRPGKGKEQKEGKEKKRMKMKETMLYGTDLRPWKLI